MRRFAQTLLISCLALLFAGGGLVQAQTSPGTPTDGQVLLLADEVTYDQNAEIVTAVGNVELSQGERILTANSVSYDRTRDIVLAEGNVTLLEPSGEVLFSDRAELHDALKTGVIENLKARFTDGSRLAASRAVRTPDQKKALEFAVFSPCKPCEENPEAAPLWQLKADRVIHDEAAKDIIYHDARLEFYGFPVAYAPYFRHPDPTVDRRSGLLAPRIGTTGELGFIYGQPILYAINQSRDLMVEPIIYTAEGTVLNSQYRQRFTHGEIDLSGTLGYVDQSENGIETGELGLEGSADLTGRFAINRSWRVGFDYEQASDRTYRRRLGLGSEEILTTGLFAEGFRGRNYASIEMLKWQDLRASTNPDDTPIVLPYAEYSHMGAIDGLGGRSTLDANLMALTRDSGADSRRMTGVYGWERKAVAAGGQLLTFGTRIQGDAYLTSDLPNEPEGDHVTGRFHPQIGLKTQYPLVRPVPNGSLLIEPMAGLVAGPNSGNKANIPNEDSQSFEFDTTNLFRYNRFEGYDKVTTGSRVDYGLRLGAYHDRGGITEVMVGQSYRFAGASAFEEGSGLRNKLSDIVGAVTVRPIPSIDFSYRFRMDTETFETRRDEVGMGYSVPGFRSVVSFVALDETVKSNLTGDREQIEASFNLAMTQNWSLSGSAVQDLSEGHSRLLRGKLGLTYADECILFGVDIERSDISDADIEPDDRILFRIVLKHLGGLQSK